MDGWKAMQPRPRTSIINSFQLARAYNSKTGEVFEGGLTRILVRLADYELNSGDVWTLTRLQDNHAIPQRETT